MDGLDAVGNATTSEAYHYHMAMEVEITGTFEGTPGGMQTGTGTL